MNDAGKNAKTARGNGEKVSLIATVLNEGESIHGFLDGLLSQTLTADEIILSDGGSTDGTEGDLC